MRKVKGKNPQNGVKSHFRKSVHNIKLVIANLLLIMTNHSNSGTGREKE